MNASKDDKRTTFVCYNTETLLSTVWSIVTFVVERLLKTSIPQDEAQSCFATITAKQRKTIHWLTLSITIVAMIRAPCIDHFPGLASPCFELRFIRIKQLAQELA